MSMHSHIKSDIPVHPKEINWGGGIKILHDGHGLDFGSQGSLTLPVTFDL